MQAHVPEHELKATLEELEQLHREEAVALRKLSRETVDELTDRKLALWERLRDVTGRVRPGPEHHELLERIWRAALNNQILLHHARDAVRCVLQEASGQTLLTPSTRPSAVQDGLRVNFRG